jgi:uncharacterized membrane protein
MVQATTTPDVSSVRVALAPRHEGVDLVRGLVMVVMVLDHTRDYFMDAPFDPTDLSRVTPGLFLTRWITHFCAPTFALLAGVGARLAGEARGRDRRALVRFLLTRGLWLILLEQTVEKFGVLFRPSPGLVLGLVLTALGGGFVLLSALVAARVPAWLIGAAGLAIIAGNNLLDLAPPTAVSMPPLLGFLMRPDMVALPGGMLALVGYPLLPWFAVVAVGYWVGGLYGLERGRRRTVLVWTGLAAIGLYVFLRAGNVYGDPRRWSRGADAQLTALSFVNCTKYPPSLQFLLMTLGPALLVLAWFDGKTGALGAPLVTLGRVPLFYYLLQWYVIHGLALGVALARGEPTGWLFIDNFPIQPPPSSSFGLPGVYGWWLVVVALLYLPSAWFARYKSRHRESAWLSYL